MRTRILLLGVLLLTCGMFDAYGKKGSGIPLIGSSAPSFTAETTNGTLRFPEDFGNNWKILFSHPQDFTPVCTSEIIELTRKLDRFEALGIKIAVISTDTKERHILWKNSMEEILRNGKQPSDIRFPLIDDSTTKISRLYGMIHHDASTTKNVRGVYYISPANVVEAFFFYPSTVGRNVEEILRTAQAVQEVHATKLYTPVNWQPGDDLLVPYFPYDTGKAADISRETDEYYFIGTSLWFKKLINAEGN